MLPPVRATLSAFVEYQNPSQQSLLRQRIDVANNAANAGTISPTPLSGGRLDIMSLSAQLQLAQGFSIFAETIGKLIKLPRREGEALVDYAQRLLEAVKAMNPAERAALEKAMNQLVKGATLRLLTEVLNNPAGPDAARFAGRLETSQLLDRDLAAKAVVSSYRQNAGAEQASTLPTPPASGGGVPPGQTTANQAQTQTQAQAQAMPQNGVANPPPETTADPAHGSDVLPEQADTPEDREVLSAEDRPGSLPAAAETEGSMPAGPAGNEMPAAVASQPAAEPEAATELAGADTPEPAADLPDETTETPTATLRSEDGRPSAADNQRRAAPVFYDGPALARLSQRNSEQVQAMPPAPRGEEKGMAGPAAEWLSEILAEGGADILEPLPATARPLPEQQALQELLDGDVPPRLAPQAEEQTGESMAKPAAHVPEEPETQAPPRPSAAPASAGGQPAGTAEAAEQMALPFALPPNLRDGVAMPYVPYPPEERERDPEERKTKAISKTDEDGEPSHQSADEQASHEEQDAGHDEAKEDGKDDPGQEGEDAGRAHDLYLRMAGWA